MTDRVVLVTGAAQGLGATIARRFHAVGYRVALGDVHADAARQLARALSADGSRAIALALDVCEKSDFEAARDAILTVWQRVDVLVNNAGRAQVVPVMDVSAEQFGRAVDVNLRSVLFGWQVFGRHFGAHGGGRIVNVASLAGQNGGTATGAHYAASKAGVLNLTKVFARDLAARGVTVNAVSPGPMDLPAVHDSVPADTLRKLVAGIPAGRLGNADFVADVAVLLAAEHAWFTTGACWDVNGGLFMR